MKQRITIFLLLLSFGLSAQVVFVNNTAVGLNNGTSWLNAYGSLDLALAAATSGTEIWVAKGTYKPTTAAPNHSFLLTEGVKMYGGFAGTETTLSQRSIVSNETILDGDILGNDIANDSLSKVDNAFHVVLTITLANNTGCLIDGFTIKNGNTRVGTANTDLTRRGGGLLAGAKTTVRNCKFSGNTGDSGAAMAALDALSTGLVIDNCIFENNKAIGQAVLFLRNTPTAVVKNCIFRNNTTTRGSFYPLSTGTLTVDSCLFENNTGASSNYGAGFYAWQANFTLSNSSFIGNTSGNAAGIYIDGRDHTSAGAINNCSFEGNTATNYGGTSIFTNQGDYTMSDCEFIGNVAPSSGAAIYHGAGTKFHISNCLFQANTGSYAGAIANYGVGCIGTFESCVFRENFATNGGGACSNGFKGDVLYKNCDFIENGAGFGAAIFTQNDTTRLRIDGCYFGANSSSGTAGAVYVNSNIAASIKNTTFQENVGTTGGALNILGDSLATIDKCYFLDNIALTQGAAINFNDANALITNTLIARNINNGDGAGGGISNNSSDSTTSNVKLVNCTIADNFALIGAEIAQWEAPAGNATLTMQNCIIQNTDGEINYQIEEGTPTVVSLGGNQSSDASLSASLTGSLDKNSTMNTFQDTGNDDYAHTIGSPASNGGVAAGAPADDINGNQRSQQPDAGAYEVNFVGTKNPNFQVLALSCAPNPAIDYTQLSWQHARNGGVQIAIWNQLGQQVASYQVEKTSNDFSYRVNTSALAAGTYKVQVRLGTVVHEGTFMKF